MFREYYEHLTRGYSRGVRQAQLNHEVDARYDPEVIAYIYTGIGNFIGMRWADWTAGGQVPDDVLDDVLEVLRRGLPPPSRAGGARIVSVMDDAAYRTIPGVLADAARRDPDGIWIRTDEGTMTFGAAAAQAAATAAALHDAGVRHGDHVLVTARTTAPYLLCWLALAWSGAVTVSANPRSAPAELAGLAQQTTPRAVITDAGLMPADPRGGPHRPAAPRCAGRGGADQGLGQPDGTGRRPATGSAASATPTSPCSSPPRAPPAGPSWSCRPTGRTRWPGRASRTGWS